MTTVITDFEEEFKRFTGARHAIACCNGTAALHTALIAIGIKHGDKVITSPFSFIATANSILYCDATPVFADIDPKTYCIDPAKVEEKMEWTPTVKAVKAVKAVLVPHIFGNVCDIDSLKQICKRWNILLVEDCAQALGATYKGKHVGNFGSFGTFSFYASKNLWTFEGGMLITNNSHLAQKARMIINHGQSEKYKHEILGYNYRMPQICALIGLTTLKLHKKAILVELGSYGIEQGHYPEVIYNQPLYKKLGITGDCPNAEAAAAAAKKVRKFLHDRT